MKVKINPKAVCEWYINLHGLVWRVINENAIHPIDKSKRVLVESLDGKDKLWLQQKDIKEVN